jgi:hypothetical protein
LGRKGLSALPVDFGPGRRDAEGLLPLSSLIRPPRGSVLRWPPYQIPNVLDTLGMYAAVTSERDVP